jgi:hypothetical protein
MCRILLAPVLIALLGFPLLAQVRHQVPTSTASLTGGAWFPYVFSKIAPLEEWNAISSANDIVRDRYNSDESFRIAKNDTYVIPRFCFRLFRVTPEAYSRLLIAIENYHGSVVWSLYNNCVGAFAQRPGYVSLAPNISPENLLKKWEEAKRNPPKPDPDFVQRAIDDIPRFCQYLESELELSAKPPLDFDTRWLTRDGLSNHPGTFENFFEPGDHMPVLRRSASQSSHEASARDQLSFGVGGSEMSDLLQELGAKYDTSQSSEPSAPEYPLLSRLDDIASGAWYGPEEINRFLAEIEAQAIANLPSSTRALDKLYRIAKWAEKLETGISFSGE